MQSKDYLDDKDLFLPKIGGKPKDMKDEEWSLLVRKAMSVIRLTLLKEVAHHTVKSNNEGVA